MPFNGILGQDINIEVLRRSLRNGKTAHAYLFHGPAGCGRRLTALALTEAMFCGKDEGCGKCPPCRKLSAGQHPDLRIIEPDGMFIKIEQIRELQRELSLRPYEAPRKVCIIEATERLHPAAANALLKTLEEPPGNALIILLAENRDSVLPTILSRCQQLRFAPLGEQLVEQLLTARGMGSEAARVAASLAEGSMTKALAVGESETLAERSKSIESVLNLSLQDVSTLFRVSEVLAKEKENALGLLEMLQSFFRDLLLMHNGSSQIVNFDMETLLQREAARLSTEAVLERLGHIAQARHSILRNVNTRLALEVLFMRLAAV